MKFNRYQAFGAHLSGSAIVALISAALVFLVWYPAPLPAATGVTGIFLILLGVDVVLGPCITLIVFNPAKKELKRDLAIVLLLQVAALLYGLNAVFVARPVYVVYNAGRFDLVYANDLPDEKLQRVSDGRFKTLPLFGPQTIAARRPSDAKTRSELLLNSLAGGDDLPQLPQHYVPYADEKAEAVKYLHTIDDLRRLNAADIGRVDSLAKRYAEREGGIAYLPLRGKVRDLAVIVGKESAAVLEIADLSPW